MSVILKERIDSILLITLNRPEVLNAFNNEMFEELENSLKEVEEDKSIRAIIITGNGKAFASGGDLNEIKELNFETGMRKARKAQKLFDYIENFPKPIIAAINGYALGGGLELAIACHLRIASENAKLGQPEINIGIIPGFGGTQRLPRLIGKTLAFEMILSGKPITAQRAYEIGLINRVVKSEELINQAKEFAQLLAEKPPIAIKCAIESINSGIDAPLEEGMKIEASLFGICCSTYDKNEGINAFLEKRKPIFKGE